MEGKQNELRLCERQLPSFKYMYVVGDSSWLALLLVLVSYVSLCIFPSDATGGLNTLGRKLVAPPFAQSGAR